MTNVHLDFLRTDSVLLAVIELVLLVVLYAMDSPQPDCPSSLLSYERSAEQHLAWHLRKVPNNGIVLVTTKDQCKSSASPLVLVPRVLCSCAGIDLHTATLPSWC